MSDVLVTHEEAAQIISRMIADSLLDKSQIKSVIYKLAREGIIFSVNGRLHFKLAPPTNEEDWFLLLPAGPENQTRPPMTVQRVMEEGGQTQVWALLTVWLRDTATRRGWRETTMENYRRFFISFCLLFGHLPASDIRCHHLEEWRETMADKHPQTDCYYKWNSSTRELAIGRVKSAFAWAKK